MITRLIKVSFFLLIALTAIGQPLEFEFSTSSMPAPGGVYDVDVKVANFEELLAAQVGIYWDSTVMRIDTLPFVTTDLPDFNRQALSLPDDNQTVVRGKLKLSWSSLSLVPQSLADGTLLFTMRFNIIGMPCDMTSLTLGDPQPPFLRIEVIHNEKDEIGAIANDFPVAIPGTDCGGIDPPVVCENGELELVYQNATVANGDNICIPMVVNNFSDVSTFQMSTGWDPSVMTYTGVQNFILPGSSPASFNVNEANGTVTYVWFDNTTVTPETFADGTALYELCFDIIGNPGTSTTIVAQSMPTVIQASNSTGDVLDTCPVPGTITVSGMPPVGEFTLISQSVTASQSTVCVDITTNNFDDIVTAQFAVQWDDSVLSYSSLTNLNQTLPLFESLFNQVGDVLRFSWNNPDPIDLPDGTVLFTICYDVVGPCNSTTPISFIGDPVPIEIAASGPSGDAVIPFQLVEGTVNVTFGCPPSGGVSITPSSTNVDCNGASTGSISLALSGGTAPYTCMWATLGTTTDNNGICVQNNLSAGTYSVTVTDSAGNSATSTPTVTEPQAIVINGNTTPASGTTGGTINYVISGGTPPYMEQFNPQVPNLNNVPAGTYTLLVTDANQCQQTQVFTVTGASNPVVVQVDGVTDSSCNSNGRICVTCTGGTGVYGNPTASSTSVSLTYDPNQRCFINVPGGTYTIRCTDSSGAIGERTVNVNTIAPSPLSCQVTNVVPAICDVFGGSFDVTCTGGCPGYAITVSLNGGPKMTYNPLSSYAAGDYTVCIRDASGGEQVINFSLPEVSNGPIEVSAGDIIDAMCDSDGSVTTTITGGCSLTCSLVNNTTLEEFDCEIGVQILSLPAGNYTLSAIDTQGDSESITFNIGSTSPDLMVSVNSIADAPCAGMNGSVSLNVTGGCGNTTCMILINNMGTPQLCTIIGGAISAPNGTHTITITDDDTGVPVSLPITVPISPDALRVNITGQTINSVDVTAMGGQMPYVFTWTFPDGTPVNIEDLSGLTMSGLYSLSVVDAMGCSAGLETTVDTLDPGIVFIVNTNTLASDCGSGNDCNGEITGTILNGATPYNITISDQFGNSQTYQIAQDGVFTLPNVCGGNYSVSYLDAAGNMGMFGSSIEVMSPDPLIIEEDDVMCSDFGESNGSVSVFVDGGNGGYDYMWTPALPNAGPSNDNLSQGTYVLNVTDINGCSASIALVVEDCAGGGDNCGEGLLVMTPNGDGRNDNLIITCADTQDNTLAIYDRYGRKVFDGTNYRNGWNGVDLDGQPLREGAYHWVYIVNGQITKGTITLLRD